MLTEKEVNHIATLARLELSDAQRERVRKDLSSILDFVAQLERADTTGVEPLYQVTGLENVTRSDAVSPIVSSAELLVGQAPHHEGRYVKVKSVKQK
jgi:aspartyl-tRNA(Asn)/glutamyl-tRNA(Gln) amidotransferase subunit C